VITIDLHDYYPWYPKGSLIDLPKEIVDTLKKYESQMLAYRRRAYRNKAHYSLDNDDGIELLVILKPLTPEEIMERRQSIARLHSAIDSLPEKQANRIYAHYFLNMSKAEIARAEGVSKMSVAESIWRGLRTMKNNFEIIF